MDSIRDNYDRRINIKMWNTWWDTMFCQWISGKCRAGGVWCRCQSPLQELKSPASYANWFSGWDCWWRGNGLRRREAWWRKITEIQFRRRKTRGKQLACVTPAVESAAQNKLFHTQNSFNLEDTGQSCDPGLNGLQHPALKCDVLFGSHGDTGGKNKKGFIFPLWWN